MIHTKNFPKSLWAEDTNTSIYILNRSPTRSHPLITLFEALYKQKPSIGHLKTFGCLAYHLIMGEKKEKLSEKVKKAFF